MDTDSNNATDEVQLATSPLTKGQVVDILHNIRAHFKIFFASADFSQRVSTLVDQLLEASLEVKQFKTSADLSTQMETIVRRAVDIVVATELKLKVLQNAKTVVNPGTVGSGMVVRSDRVLYVAIPVVLMLAAAPFVGAYALVAAFGGGAIGYCFAIDSVQGVKEQVMEKVMQEVRAAEILPDDKLRQVLKRTTTVYTVDNVFRMLCCKRWTLSSPSLHVEHSEPVFYSFDVQDVVFEMVVHCKFRFSRAHALYSTLVAKYPAKTALLNVFPSKYPWSLEEREQRLWKFVQLLQHDPVLSTSEEVINFLGLSEEIRDGDS